MQFEMLPGLNELHIAFCREHWRTDRVQDYVLSFTTSTEAFTRQLRQLIQTQLLNFFPNFQSSTVKTLHSTLSSNPPIRRKPSLSSSLVTRSQIGNLSLPFHHNQIQPTMKPFTLAYFMGAASVVFGAAFVPFQQRQDISS